MFGWDRSRQQAAPNAQADLFEPAAFVAALDRQVADYLKRTDNGELVYPAAKRRSRDASGSVRAIWEHTRLEACRYAMMVPGGDLAPLVEPARQAEMIETYLRQPPHENTVVDFTGVAAVDFSIAIVAGLNWLDHCALLAGAAPDAFKRTRSDFRHLVVLADRWWRMDGAGARCREMLAGRETPPLMFYLMWQDYTRLAKEVAVAAAYGASLDQAAGRQREQLQTTLRAQPAELAVALAAHDDSVRRLRSAGDPGELGDDG